MFQIDVLLERGLHGRYTYNAFDIMIVIFALCVIFCSFVLYVMSLRKVDFFYNGEKSVVGKRIEKLQRRKSKAKQRARKKYHAEGEQNIGEQVSSENFDTYGNGYDDDEDYDDKSEDDTYDAPTMKKGDISSSNSDIKSRVFDDIVFPSIFTIKVIGINSENFPDEVLNAIEAITGNRPKEGYSTKVHKKYCSVTVSPTFKDADQLYECYQKMRENPQVKFVL